MAEAALASDLTEQDADEPEETGPLRRCAVTRERQAKEAMIRFVVGPDRAIVPDLAAKLPGRGIWLSARGDVVETARNRGAFARAAGAAAGAAARGPVVVPPDLAAALKLGLRRRIGDTLGLARRAGQAVFGFAKAREFLASGHVGLVVQASDGSAEERARFLGGHAVAVVTPLDAAGLGALFGREHVVHVSVRAGRLADMLRIDAQRLSGLEERAGAEKPARLEVQGGVSKPAQLEEQSE